MRRRVVSIVVALLPVQCFVGAVGGGLAHFYYGAAEEAGPVVFITPPAHGEQTEMGDTVTVRAIARDEMKATPVELWADGVWQTSQEDSLPGGVSPFPLLAI